MGTFYLLSSVTVLDTFLRLTTYVVIILAGLKAIKAIDIYINKNQ